MEVGAAVVVTLGGCVRLFGVIFLFLGLFLFGVVVMVFG